MPPPVWIVRVSPVRFISFKRQVHLYELLAVGRLAHSAIFLKIQAELLRCSRERQRAMLSEKPFCLVADIVTLTVTSAPVCPQVSDDFIAYRADVVQRELALDDLVYHDAR